jgi:hypothetical protein
MLGLETLTQIRQSMGMDKRPPHRPPIASLSTELFQSAGNALYGKAWHADLARLLGLPDRRRIAEMAKGRRPVKSEFAEQLAQSLETRAAEALATAAAIRKHMDDAEGQN